MSSISKLDTKETNSTELLNIPEGPELMGMSNSNNIETGTRMISNILLDKTNVETYMNDFNKNFYKIKFDNVLLEDMAELYGIKEDAANAKDLRNKSFGVNQDNNSKEDKLIQPVPIGMRGLITSTNN